MSNLDFMGSMKHWNLPKAMVVVYKKANDTSRAGRTRLRRINPNQNHNKHHTPGIIVYIKE